MSDRLSGLDASFLHLEQGGAHMHVAGTSIFEGPKPDYDEFREHVASRLHLVPRFRQRLRFVPLGLSRPVWEDDPHLNLEYHVRQTALPPPGTEEQLRTLAARIFSQRLDRSKPLWEMWLVDGLEGDRFAIVGKSHHCLVDGVSGVDINTVLFDLEREPAGSPSSPDRWLPRPEPSGAEVLAEAVLDRLTNPREIVEGVTGILRAPREIAGRIQEGLGAIGELVGAGLGAPPSPFNVEIGGYRRFSWVRADLGQFKQIKNALGGTVNDVVLAVVTGGLGRYLRAHGHSTADLELRAMVPISVRSEEERGALGNRVSAMMAPLPVGVEDPVKRLHMITETMGDLKDSRQAVGATLLTELTAFAPPTIVAQAARLQSRQRFFNLVVTNVPGPQFPLYVLGRELLATFPMVPLAERQAVCVGIMSYNGLLNFGLIGDYDAMPGLEQLARDLDTAIAELAAVAAASPTPREAPAAAQAHDGAGAPDRG
ncbi:MAG TPA: wax ester/triacylglycerol synthase family O-acyltransferase [Solirubrobacterales bacterium]|nr:wax ester/triacylglycerol synthase family O-acyltransferase [Solirubrobacterales bacterium]